MDDLDLKMKQELKLQQKERCIAPRPAEPSRNPIANPLRNDTPERATDILNIAGVVPYPPLYVAVQIGSQIGQCPIVAHLVTHRAEGRATALCNGIPAASVYPVL